MDRPNVSDFLGDDAIAALRRPIAEARGLPGRTFTDPGFFRLEEEALFARSWTGVAFAQDMPEPGDALPLTYCGLPVVLVRGHDRRVRAFHNVCRHRGTKVVRAPMKGAGALRCLYHSWTWELDGKLRATPLWDGTRNPLPPDIRKEESGLVPIRCEVRWDIVHLDLSGRAPLLEDAFGLVAERHRHYDFGALRPVATGDWDFAANWKLGVEGAIEGYHEPWLHPQLPSRVVGGNRPVFTPHIRGDCMGTTIPVSSGYDLDRIGAGRKFPPLPGPGPGGADDRGLDIFALFPNTVVVVAPDHVLNALFLPLAADRTRARLALYVAADAAADPDLAPARDELWRFWSEIMVQDGEAIEAQQEARHSPVGDDIRFSPFWEGRIQYFEQRVVDALLKE